MILMLLAACAMIAHGEPLTDTHWFRWTTDGGEECIYTDEDENEQLTPGAERCINAPSGVSGVVPDGGLSQVGSEVRIEPCPAGQLQKSTGPDYECSVDEDSGGPLGSAEVLLESSDAGFPNGEAPTAASQIPVSESSTEAAWQSTLSLAMDRTLWTEHVWDAAENGAQDFFALTRTSHASALSQCTPLTNGKPFYVHDWDATAGAGVATSENSDVQLSSDECLAGPGEDIGAVCWCDVGLVKTYPGALGNGTAAAGSTTQLEVAGIVWSDNQFNGQWVKVRPNGSTQEWRLIDDTFADGGGGNSRITWTTALTTAAAASDPFLIAAPDSVRLKRDPTRLVGTSVWRELRVAGSNPIPPSHIFDGNVGVRENPIFVQELDEPGACVEHVLAHEQLNTASVRSLADVMMRRNSVRGFWPRASYIHVAHFALRFGIYDADSFTDTLAFVGFVAASKGTQSVLDPAATTANAAMLDVFGSGVGIVLVGSKFCLYSQEFATGEFSECPAALDFSSNPSSFYTGFGGSIEFLMIHYFPSSFANSYRKVLKYRRGFNNQERWQTALDCQAGQACFDTSFYLTNAHRQAPFFSHCKATGSTPGDCGGTNADCTTLGVQKIRSLYRFQPGDIP